jgi:phage tail-like protein
MRRLRKARWKKKEEAPVANGQEQPAAAPGTFIDPYPNYNFRVEIAGVTEGHFTEIANLSVKIEAISYREGGLQQVEHRIPGRVQYGDITLRYGVTSSTELWSWLMAAASGNVDRRHVSIIMLGSDGSTEVMRWNLINAWPRYWRGAPLDALGRDVALSELTLVYETVEQG